MKQNTEKIKIIANKLKQIRTERKKTQQEVADFLGMTKQSYYKYEKGIVAINMNLLLKLSKYYGLPEFYFLFDQDKDNEYFMVEQWINLYNVIHKKIIENNLLILEGDEKGSKNKDILSDELLSIQRKIIDFFDNKTLELDIDYEKIRKSKE